MARLAIILHEGSPGSRELRLSRTLDFFGLAWRMVEISNLADMNGSSLEYAVFGSIRAVAASLNCLQGADPSILRPAAIYAYLDDERSRCVSALRCLLGNANVSLQEAP